MRLLPTDPDIETLLRRINDGTIDLQPDFQRGEVWGAAKQKRLIDSILRNWYIPPIHVIEHSSAQPLEVLDGQQRLAAIRDYANGNFSIDGKLEPVSEDLARLDGIYFASLPPDARQRFLRFPIRVYTILAFEPGEPAELFFRLNQQVSLTPAEQRNAFFGPVREQIRELANRLETPPLGGQTLGFGNSRMAYDDVIARVCLTLEQGTLRKKVTAAVLSNRYRSKYPFPLEIIGALGDALNTLSNLVGSSEDDWHFNKPILHSWLLFLSAIGPRASNEVNKKRLDLMTTIYHRVINFEKPTPILEHGIIFMSPDEDAQFLSNIASIFRDRATSRVSDVSSVVYRDMFLWVLYYVAIKATGRFKQDDECPQIMRLDEALALHKKQNPKDHEFFFTTTEVFLGWAICDESRQSERLLEASYLPAASTVN